jgi:predicted transport protein
VRESVDQRIERLRGEVERLGEDLTNETYEQYAAVKDQLRAAEFEKKYNARRMTLAERDEILKPLESLNAEAPEYGRWTKGDKLPGGSKVGGIFKPAGDTSGVLFRGVTLEDWKRIQQQGFIDTDGRGAISPGDEQINLAKHASTSVEYIPSGGEGVVLAIDPKGLDIFMIGADDYPRARNRIPLENVKAVSEVFKKGRRNELLAPTIPINEQNTQGQPGTQAPVQGIGAAEGGGVVVAEKEPSGETHPALIGDDGTPKRLYHGKAAIYPNTEIKVKANNMSEPFRTWSGMVLRPTRHKRREV